MGKKRAASQTVARKQTDKAVKLYEELTSLNDQLLTLALSPNAKEIENSSREISELVQKILKLQTDDTETG
ncbi:hypothetical protein EB796_015586 [Bugula neritina]|uniref:Uncharacterized protein n=1 Tax=Bugula neritina TaxID=10212 RepID=A0A7J7JKF3_BUGNE|nr:hypothetical protein EB796_015586 [Bugula neritina]